MHGRKIKCTARVRSGKQYAAHGPVPIAPDFNNPRPSCAIEKKNPTPGHRHTVTIQEVRRFLTILPEWPTLSAGLNVILLAPAQTDCDGFHRPGLVALCAQPRLLSQTIPNVDYVDAHRSIWKRLGVRLEKSHDGMMVHWTNETRRAFFLLHVLIHELGHHHDRMTTRSKRRASRGERFAEDYAKRNGDRIWDSYFELFA